MIRRHVLLGTFLLGLAAPLPKAEARDWPQWRGPNHDGAAASFREPASWPEALSELYKVEAAGRDGAWTETGRPMDRPWCSSLRARGKS